MRINESKLVLKTEHQNREQKTKSSVAGSLKKIWISKN